MSYLRLFFRFIFYFGFIFFQVLSYMNYFFLSRSVGICVKLLALKIHKQPLVNNTGTPTHSAVQTHW